MVTDTEQSLVGELYHVSDNAHFLGGASAVLVAFIYFGMAGSFWASGIIVVFAAIKEGYWDPRHETKIVAGSGWRDFFGYCVGVAIAIVTCLFKLKLGGMK